MDPERPQTDWDERVAKAKRDGTWFTPDEEPSPYPPRERRRRFRVGFVVAFAASLVLRTLLHVVLGEPGSHLSFGHLLDAVIGSLFIAFFVGWMSTRPPRKRR